MMTLASLVGLYAICAVVAYALIADYGRFDMGALIVACGWPILVIAACAIMVWGFLDDAREIQVRKEYDDGGSEDPPRGG